MFRLPGEEEEEEEEEEEDDDDILAPRADEVDVAHLEERGCGEAVARGSAAGAAHRDADGRRRSQTTDGRRTAVRASVPPP